VAELLIKVSLRTGSGGKIGLEKGGKGEEGIVAVKWLADAGADCWVSSAAGYGCGFGAFEYDVVFVGYEG
jgi:hypothetical protein